jgi:DNA-binding winged helix-turn-helix (wHTH) protein
MEGSTPVMVDSNGVAATAGALGSLAAVATELAVAPAVERIVGVVAEAARRALGAPVVIAMFDEAGGRLRRVHAIPGHAAVRTGAAELVVPIPPAGQPLGAMFVGRTLLTADERAYLNVLASLCALALRMRRGRFASHLRVGDIDIDLGEQRVVIGDREAGLTPSETRLLLFLAAHPGRARTRREILGHLWHSEHVGDERACDAHISNLRRKIERDPSRPERVVTVRGVGYALAGNVKVRSYNG